MFKKKYHKVGFATNDMASALLFVFEYNNQPNISEQHQLHVIVGDDEYTHIFQYVRTYTKLGETIGCKLLAKILIHDYDIFTKALYRDS